MARYLIFEKTKAYNYKFKGSSSGNGGNKAIINMKMRGTTISNKGIYIAIPTSQFMKYQLNPTSKKRMVRGKQAGIITTWKKPK